MSITRLHVGPRLSRIVIHNDTVYLTGCIAERTKGKKVGEQTREILGMIDRLLAEAASDKTRTRYVGIGGRTRLGAAHDIVGEFGSRFGDTYSFENVE